MLLFAIQAPVLGPRAFGLISIVMIFVGFCEFVPCEAAADALISVREIDHEHFDTMTTANLALALLVGACIFMGAPRIARWFGDPELAGILRAMSILPAISAVAAAPTAATKRDMQFRPIALRTMGSVFIGGVLGLVLTLTGAGVWALVWQSIVTRLVASIVLWAAVPLDFRLGFSARHFKDLIEFAVPTMFSRFLNWSSQQLPRLLFGLFWGSTELGLFSLATRLGDLLMEVAVVPRNAVARVELRTLASNPAGLNAAVRHVLTMMTVFCFPLCCGGAAIVPTLFHVWLDQRWLAAIVPAQCMLLMCMGLITQYLGGATLLALNFQRAEAVVSIAQTLLTVVLVLVFAPFGLTVASVGIAARPFLLMPLSVDLLKRKCSIPPSTVFLAQYPALGASVAMGVCVWLLRLALAGKVSDGVALPILVAAGAGFYVLMVVGMMPSVVAQFTNRPLGRT